jgi:uncharacterized FAD-dependent dehydrogenase
MYESGPGSGASGMGTDYDVIIIGAGPAGIFCALDLLRRSSLRVLMLEKGEDLDRRIQASGDSEKPNHRQARSLTSGWGGAGALSDGKLTLSPEVGGQLASLLPAERVEALIREVDEIYLGFGAPERLYGGDEEAVRDLARRAALAELRLVPAPIRHLGTERCLAIARKMREEVGESAEVRAETAAERILVEDGRAVGVRTRDGAEYRARFVVAAPGREGSSWLAEEAQRLGLSRADNPVDVGVRIEAPAEVLRALSDVAYEPKLVFFSKLFDDKVRTFCMCPYGEVVVERTDHVITVNGHSWGDYHTDNTNVALLVSTSFTEPFKDPIHYGQYLVGLANLLSGGVIVQRLGDLKAGRRSTPERIGRGLVRPTLKEATPGDLSFALPYRYLASILEMIEALDRLAPGTASPHTLLYGVEVKFYSARIKVTPALETEVGNLFAIGDGPGLTRGLVQASASGLVAARAIAGRGGM